MRLYKKIAILICSLPTLAFAMEVKIDDLVIPSNKGIGYLAIKEGGDPYDHNGPWWRSYDISCTISSDGKSGQKENLLLIGGGGSCMVNGYSASFNKNMKISTTHTNNLNCQYNSRGGYNSPISVMNMDNADTITVSNCIARY